MDAFRSSQGKAGVVDFVQSYIETDQVPSVSEYICKCHILEPSFDGETLDESEGFNIDIMPAGGDDDTYARRFAAVDWNDLYNNKNGFLVMEDLRAQWAALGYEYVLIDSRTGHTDVGGICTRQLPDAVVAVFFPNEQNLVGLSQVVEMVRGSSARGKPIDLIFVASRVPRLDDEHGHLRNWLEQAQNRLRYSGSELVTIEQYDSLMLLNQVLFVLARPKSGLASQYKQLESQLARRNIEDSVGALAFARDAARGNARRRTSLASGPRPEDEQLLTRLREIQKVHDKDPIIQHALARAFYQQQSLFDAALASDYALAFSLPGDGNVAVPPNFTATVNRLRLRIFSAIDFPDQVHQSALSILGDPFATEEAVLDAMLALAQESSELLPDPNTVPALVSASPERLMAVALRLAASPAATDVAASIAARAIAESPEGYTPDSGEHNNLQLLLIAGGKFDVAVKISKNPPVADVDHLQDIFNRSVALWGRDGHPDVGAFNSVVNIVNGLDAIFPIANLYQCAALAAAVIEDKENTEKFALISKDCLTDMATLEFSCWSYFNEQKSKFEEHLDSILAFCLREGPPPEVLTRAWAGSNATPGLLL